MSKNRHVVKHGDGWAVRKEHSDRVSSTHPTQRDAIESAKKGAQRDRGEVVIHGRDGKIRDKDSYGPDANPPKDEKH
jgi:uncharacterized protein YdaT